MPLSVLFIHAPSAAFAEGLILGSTNIAARRIGGVGRAAPPLPLGSGGTPAIFGYFPLLESNKQKAAHAATGADSRNAVSMEPARRAQRNTSGLPGNLWYLSIAGKEQAKVGPRHDRGGQQEGCTHGAWRVLPLLPGQKWRKVGSVTKRGNKKKHPGGPPRQSLVPFHCWKSTSKSRPTPRPE